MLEIPSIYKKFTGVEMPDPLLVVGHDDEIKDMKKAILEGKLILLHGPPGVGKSIAARKVAHDLGKIIKEINISLYRTGEMLGEQLFGCHRIQSEVIYLFEEIDNFHWKSHAYFLSVLKEAMSPIIMTCNNIEDVGATTVKYLKSDGLVLRFEPPTMEDLETLITKKFPAFEGKAKQFYNHDFREVLRRMEFEWFSEKKLVVEVKAQHVAGSVFGNRNHEQRFKMALNCSDPVQWILPWIDYNAPKFFKEPAKLADMLDKVSIIDSWSRRTNKKYIAGMIASLPCASRKTPLDFPGPLFAAEKRPEKEEVEVEEVTKVKMKIDTSSADPFAEF